MITKNLQNLQNQIFEVASRCGRQPEAIQLVAVSKKFPVSSILEASASGQLLFGENYIQEAQQKYLEIDKNIHLHFIGHLQTNKAKIAAKIFQMIQTVDSAKLAVKLNRHLDELDKKLDILIQVNVGRDSKKSGVLPEDAEELITTISALSNIRIKGLMTMPPWTSNPEDSRPFFQSLRELSESLQTKQLFYDNTSVELSMGMSHDFHVAIEEGSTFIRIGTAIFGQRLY